MASRGPRRSMDWTTAWRAMLPVYAFALVLEAFYPLFALVPWVVFLIYAFKSMTGSRVAEDPWQGRGSPRVYLQSFVGLLAVHLGGFPLALLGVPGVLETALLFGFAAFVFAALFVKGSAPPRIARERSRLRLGVGLAIAYAVTLAAALYGVLPAAGPEGIGVLAVLVALGIGSAAAFADADRRASRSEPLVARRTAKR